MGWFDEQIRQRKQNDEDVFADAFANMASAVMGKKVGAAFQDSLSVSKDAIDAILKYYHVKTREVPDNISDAGEQLEYLLRPHGIMRRTVQLADGWYRNAAGAMLGTLREDGRAVALLPAGLTGYCYLDPATGAKKRIGSSNQDLFEAEALVFYKPFPLAKISLPSLMHYILET